MAHAILFRKSRSPIFVRDVFFFLSEFCNNGKSKFGRKVRPEERLICRVIPNKIVE